MINEIPVIKEFYALGTVIRLQAYGENANKAVLKVNERINDIDDKMSIFKDYSEVSQINKLAGIAPKAVSDDTFSVVKKAVYYGDLSNGAIDITIKPLVSLWNIKDGNGVVPDRNSINSKVKLVNYKDIILDENHKSIMLKRKNQAIDVGCIAKGFSADIARDILIENHIESALLDLGGNIFALGNKTDGTKWSIGIQDPLSKRGDYIGIVSVNNKSIVTSGNYERYFTSEGKKYHHIIDPRTGFPSENGVISTTIISDDSVDGDGLTTCAYILGAEKGMELIKSIDGVYGIIITEDRCVYITSELENSFQLTNNKYKII